MGRSGLKWQVALGTGFIFTHDHAEIFVKTEKEIRSGTNTGNKESKSDLCNNNYKIAAVLKQRVKNPTDVKIEIQVPTTEIWEVHSHKGTKQSKHWLRYM